MVASSVVSTILILNYHHRNADTHEMSDWVSIGCTPYLYVESLVPHSPYMLCTGQKGRWKCKIGMPQIIRGKSHSKWSGMPCIVGMTPSTFNGACFPIPVERSAMARKAPFSAPAKGSTRHGLMRNVVWVLRVLNLQWGPLRISLRVQFANASSGWAVVGFFLNPFAIFHPHSVCIVGLTAFESTWQRDGFCANRTHRCMGTCESTHCLPPKPGDTISTDVGSRLRTLSFG